MCSRASLTILIVVMLLSANAAFAAQDAPLEVPEASAYILAPMGVAAVVAAERRRRRLAKVKKGVGLAYYAVKRALDIILALTMLLVAMPLFALISLIIRLDSPGPILYKRRAVGKNGKEFDMYKFRSMVDRAEEILQQDDSLKKEYYVNAKLKTDPRVTKVGKFLRKTSLDELPQLINVLIGNMTFVGPRPIASDEIHLYGPSFDRFITVCPGLTGLWQTCGRSETSYEERVKMDMLYIEKRTILLDLWILLYTVPAVLLKRGAY